MSEYKKEIGVAVAAAVALAVLAGGTAIYLFPHSTSFSLGTKGPPYAYTWATSVSCSFQDRFCRIIIFNALQISAQASGCEWQSVYSVNNRTLTTVDEGAGVLSNEPMGPSANITIPADSSASVYCTITTQSSYVEIGSQAGGEVLFTNQSLDVQFRNTWQ